MDLQRLLNMLLLLLDDLGKVFLRFVHLTAKIEQIIHRHLRTGQIDLWRKARSIKNTLKLHFLLFVHLSIKLWRKLLHHIFHIKLFSQLLNFISKFFIFSLSHLKSSRNIKNFSFKIFILVANISNCQSILHNFILHLLNKLLLLLSLFTHVQNFNSNRLFHLRQIFQIWDQILIFFL